MGKYKTFEQAKFDIESKYPYLTLLTYNGANNECLIFDEDYTQFSGIYSRIFSGMKSHPERAKINKKNKFTATCLKKYGCKNVFQNEDIKKKCKETLLENYNVENISQLEETKDKKRKTCFKNHGVEIPLKSKIILEKVKKTVVENYNVENVFQLENIKNKIKESMLNTNKWFNINGESLFEFYSKSDFSVSYEAVLYNYKLYGKIALNNNFYIKRCRVSKIANQWLDKAEDEIGYKLIREYRIPETKYHADGYDNLTNTIYEFNGDYWHANLDIYLPNAKYNKKYTFKQINDKKIKKENKIKELGYNLISIWESDFNSLI